MAEQNASPDCENLCSIYQFQWRSPVSLAFATW